MDLSSSAQPQRPGSCRMGPLTDENLSGPFPLFLHPSSPLSQLGDRSALVRSGGERDGLTGESNLKKGSGGGLSEGGRVPEGSGRGRGEEVRFG